MQDVSLIIIAMSRLEDIDVFSVDVDRSANLPCYHLVSITCTVKIRHNFVQELKMTAKLKKCRFVRPGAKFSRKFTENSHESDIYSHNETRFTCINCVRRRYGQRQ